MLGSDVAMLKTLSFLQGGFHDSSRSHTELIKSTVLTRDCFKRAIISILQRLQVDRSIFIFIGNLAALYLFLPGLLDTSLTAIIQHGKRLSSCLFQVDAQALQHARCNTFALAQQPQQQVLRPNIMMIQAARFIHRVLNHLLCSRGQPDLPQHDTVSTTNHKLDGTTRLLQVYTKITQYFGANPFAFAYQPQQDMLRANIIVLETLRFFLRKT